VRLARLQVSTSLCVEADEVGSPDVMQKGVNNLNPAREGATSHKRAPGKP